MNPENSKAMAIETPVLDGVKLPDEQVKSAEQEPAATSENTQSESIIEKAEHQEELLNHVENSTVPSKGCNADIETGKTEEAKEGHQLKLAESEECTSRVEGTQDETIVEGSPAILEPKCKGKNSSTKLHNNETKSLAAEVGNDESKARRRSKLSLNSEAKSKSKFKEDTNQASIISFLQKMSPKGIGKDVQKCEKQEQKSNCIKETSNSLSGDLQEIKQILSCDSSVENCESFNPKSLEDSKHGEDSKSSTEKLDFKGEETELLKTDQKPKAANVADEEAKDISFQEKNKKKNQRKLTPTKDKSSKSIVKRNSSHSIDITDATEEVSSHSKQLEEESAHLHNEKEATSMEVDAEYQKDSPLKRTPRRKYKNRVFSSSEDEESTEQTNVKCSDAELLLPKSKNKENIQIKLEKKDESKLTKELRVKSVNQSTKKKNNIKATLNEAQESVKSVKKTYEKDKGGDKQGKKNFEDPKQTKSSEPNTNLHEESDCDDEASAETEEKTPHNLKQPKEKSARKNKEESSEDSDAKENRKVRFSDKIQEFSPEPARKNHASGKLEDNDRATVQIDVSDDSNERPTPEIKNAFTFMMSSRFKVIGQNSPGKEAEKSDEPEAHKDGKAKLSVRKAIFQDWADAKGAKKRKDEDKEKGIVIEHKLKKRAKRLKKMLTQEPNANEMEDKIKVARKKHKVARVIEDSDVDDQEEKESEDDTEDKTKNGPDKAKETKLNHNLSSNAENDKMKNELHKTKHKAKKDLSSDDAENKAKNEVSKAKSKEKKHKHNLSAIDAEGKMKNELDKAKVKKPKYDLNSDDTEDKTKNGPDTAKSKERKLQHNLSSKNAEDKTRHKVKKRKHSSESIEIEKENNALDEDIFVKHKKPKLLSVETSRSDSCVVTIEETDAESSTNEKALKKNPSTPLQQTDLSSFFGIINSSKKSASVKSKLQLKQDPNEETLKLPSGKKKKSKLKTKLTLKKSLSTVDDLSNSSAEMKDDSSLNTCTSVSGDDQTIEEFEIDAKKKEVQVLLTPRTLKKWTMRLRVKLTGQDDEAIEKLLQPLIHAKSGKSEDEQEIVKTKKKPQVLESSDSDSDKPLASRRSYKEKANQGGKSDEVVKLAPLFIKAKAKPKPKLDKATIDARKKFLHSSLPEALKKVVEKQQRVEEVEYEIFPSVSHIRATPTDAQLTEGTINFWNLPAVDLKLTSYAPICPDVGTLSLGSLTNSNALDDAKLQLQNLPKITKFKKILKAIKAENPDYPVYKAFKFLHQKHSKDAAEHTSQELAPEAQPPATVKKAKRGRPRKKPKPIDEDCVKVVEVTKPEKGEHKSKNQELWTDKYRPCAPDEIFGNGAAISQLKTWLGTWLQFSEEINMQRGKRKRRDSGSSSEFESTDTDSRDNSRLPGNTVILCGPCGSGKTSAIYALCGNLGVNVLELNASSKRTGKRLLLELQEATQSHQVRKKDSSSLTAFLKSDKTSDSSRLGKKMCLLLIEDVDLVFEQDESFLSALSQLLAMSKRPVVLTTTDTNCLHLKKFFVQYPIINFAPLSARILATWLQVLCLVEGLLVDRRAVVELLERNEGDARRTLLQLQFWVQSGQLKILETSSAPGSVADEARVEDGLCKDDDCSNISWLNEEEAVGQNDVVDMHSNCPDTFRCFKSYNHLYNSLPLDMGNVWWNLSDLLGIPRPLGHLRAEKTKEIERNSKDQKLECQNLRNISNVFDTLAVTDVLYEKLTIDCDLEPVHRTTTNRLKNSLELNEPMESCSTTKSFVCEWSHSMLDGYIGLYNNSTTMSTRFDYSAGDEKQWRTKQNKCTEMLLDVVPISCHLDCKSVSLDYWSSLRTMARSEAIRANINNKRGNRFYNYLRGLGINCNDSYFKNACSVFCHEA